MCRAVGVPIGRTSGEYTTSSRTRITLTAQDGTNTYVYTNPRKMLIEVASSGGMQVLVETRTGANYQSSGAWSTFGTYSISGWSGWNDIPLVLGTLGGGTTQTGNNWQLRLTFIMTSKNNDYPTTAQVNKLRIFGENNWFTPSTLANTNDLYSYDMSQNALFPAIVQGTRFTSTVATGTSPLTVTSTTAVTNLNADLLDGNHASAFVLKAGDTMTANLNIQGAKINVGNVSGDDYVEISQYTGTDAYGFTTEFSNASVISNQQGGTNQYLILGDNSTTSSTGTLLGVSILQSGVYTPRLDLKGNGDFSFSGTLTGGTVPFARLTGAAAASHSHAIADVTGLQTALDSKVDENAAITAGTATKITYDAKGLVTAGTTLSSGDLPSHTHTASQISDSGNVGRNLLTTSSATASTLFFKKNPDHTITLEDAATFRTSTGTAAASHTHAISDVTNLQTSLDGKAATSHSHAASDVTSGTFATARIPTLGNITNAGAIGSTANLGVVTTTSGVLTTRTLNDDATRGVLSSSSTDLTTERNIYWGTRFIHLGVTTVAGQNVSRTISFTTGMKNFILQLHQDTTTGAVIARLPLTITNDAGTSTDGQFYSLDTTTVTHRVAWSNGSASQIMNVSISYSGTTITVSHNFNFNAAFRLYGY